MIGQKLNMFHIISVGTIKQVCFGIITLLIYVLMGVCRSYAAFLIHQLDLPDSNIRLNDHEKTSLAAGVGLLTPFSSLVAGYVMDTFGRKKCLALIFIPFIVSWTMVSLATNYLMLLIAMIIKSIAFGTVLSSVTYISEISSTKYRGLLLALVDVMLNLGVIMSSSLMYFLKWNVVSIIFAVASVVFFSLTLILPESPIWLYSKGRKDEAIRTLCELRSQQRHELEMEIQDMENSCSNQRTGFLVVIVNCLKAWKQFLIASILFLLLVFAGPFILLSYTVTIIQKLGVPYDAPTIALIYSTAGFCGSFMTPVFVHNLRRKVILAISSAGMTISLAAVLLYEVLFAEDPNRPFAWIVPFFLCCFTLLNNLGALPIGFVIGGELFPLEARGTLQGMYGFLVNVTWALSLKFYPLVMFTYGIQAMLLCFTIGCLLLVLYAVFVLPETKGRTLNEVQEQYFNRKKIRELDT